jgi:protein TonB
VPGVSQGIPPDLIKGQQPGEGDPLMQQHTASAPAAVPPKSTQQVERKPKPKPKAKPKPKVVRAPAPAPSQQAAPQQPQSTANQPAHGTQAPWPSAPPAQASGTNAPWPSSSPNSAPAPWPDAPPPGTFSR